MKTTIEIPEETLSRAEKHAGEKGISLDDLIKEAVEKCLPPKPPEPGPDGEHPWMQTFGMLSDLKEENARIMDIINRDCRQIDESDWE